MKGNALESRGVLREQQNAWTAGAEQYARALAFAEKLQQVEMLTAEDKGDVNLVCAASQRVRVRMK